MSQKNVGSKKNRRNNPFTDPSVRVKLASLACRLSRLDARSFASSYKGHPGLFICLITV